MTSNSSVELPAFQTETEARLSELLKACAHPTSGQILDTLIPLREIDKKVDCLIRWAHIFPNLIERRAFNFDISEPRDEIKKCLERAGQFDILIRKFEQDPTLENYLSISKLNNQNPFLSEQFFKDIQADLKDYIGFQISTAEGANQYLDWLNDQYEKSTNMEARKQWELKMEEALYHLIREDDDMMW